MNGFEKIRQRNDREARALARERKGLPPAAPITIDVAAVVQEVLAQQEAERFRETFKATIAFNIAKQTHEAQAAGQRDDRLKINPASKAFAHIKGAIS